MYDVIVVGLGPAGSTAAYHLAKKGLSVVAIDKARFPRYKSCGGCISTKVVSLLDFDISEVIEETVFGATFTYKCQRTMDIISERPVGHNLMRDRFDHFLVQKAREKGVSVIEGCRVCDIDENSGSVTVKCEDGRSFSSRVLVGADGASGLVGRSFGLDPREAAVSITTEIPYNRDDFHNIGGRLFIDFGTVPFGYGWIFPKKNYLSVGIAGDTVKVKGKIKEFFSSIVNGHDLLNGLEPGDRVGWTVPTHYNGAGPMARGRVILVGDTGHLVDPFLGEGIYYAVKTAMKASEVIAESISSGSPDLSEYQQWLEEFLYPEFSAAEKLSDLVYNHPRLWYKILERTLK